MSISKLLKKLISGADNNERYQYEIDDDGLNYFVSSEITEKISSGQSGLLVTHQHIGLKMLVEQGDAEEIPNGFIISSDIVVNLDKATQELLNLPVSWTGNIKADVKGETGRSNFYVSLKAKTQSNSYTGAYSIEGPVIKFTETQKYILTPAQYIIFNAVKHHQSTDKSEYDNLQLILALQAAQEQGAGIDLAHFDKLNIKAPDSISIEAEVDGDGNLVLTPFMGQDATHEKVQKVLGQLKSKNATALRVGEEIVLFDEKKLSAVHEILKNRVVPKEKIKQFYENPTAFIDASLVDLDIGFSSRVHGATKFKHAYFGETDESGIDWFGASTSSASILPITKLSSYIDDVEKLFQFKSKLEDAQKTGADEIQFADKVFDISDKESVAKIVKEIEKKITDGSGPDVGKPEGTDEKEGDDKKEMDIAVIDVELNDEELDKKSPSIEESISKVLYPLDKLEWSNYLRKPFPHQYTGIQWILGLALSSDKLGGGLLADDMGLGKTMMALSAVDHLYKIDKENGDTLKPCLIVAPLSLLQNWKDEVEQTFSSSPFKDIIILQSDADLNRYRDGGVETRQNFGDDETAEIRYSLKVGEKHLQDRLDMPQRLVITTFQTLRDYQFSLCTIDWGMVIFDEAQNIKNPNTLQTRAAKGLKADFKLLATGTPVENSLADFWCLMDTACPGHLDSYQSFRQNYVAPILQAAGDEVEEIRGRVGRELRIMVGSLMLRRVKEDHIEGLPSKDIFVGIEDDDWKYLPSLMRCMSGSQLDGYNATLSAQDEAETNMVLSGLQRLRDVSLHPQLSDGGALKVPETKSALESLMTESGKMQSLLTTLDDIQRRKEKCIIFVVNKRLQAFLSLGLGQHYRLGPLSVINGDTKAVAKRASVPTRKSLIKDFEARDGFNIIVMSPVAAGVGLTIVGANNVIHLERHWNPAKEAQATDRVYRIGQVKDVNVYVPILHHPEYESFDVNLHRLVSKKILLKDAVVTPEQVIPAPGGFGEGKVYPAKRITADELAKLSWSQFEALCAELFSSKYDVDSCWLTQNGSDFGADVAMVTKSFGILVQCKHTKGAKYNGYKAIQEVQGAAIIYSSALGKDVKTLIFATNAKILPAATKELAVKYNVLIFSHDQIKSLLDSHEVTYEMVLKRLDKKRINVQ